MAETAPIEVRIVGDANRLRPFTDEEIFLIDLALHHRVYSTWGPGTKSRREAEMELRQEVRREAGRRH